VVGSRFLSPQTFLQFGHYFVKTHTVCFIYFLVLKCNILVSRFGVYDIINWFRDADCWWISHESSTEIYIYGSRISAGRSNSTPSLGLHGIDNMYNTFT
jgi:hypothetical protein